MASKNAPLELVLETDTGADVTLDNTNTLTIDDVEEHKPEEEAIIPIDKIEKIKPGSTLGVSSKIEGNVVSSLIVDVDENLQSPVWCIYGKNGTGKTTLLSTYPGMLILAPDEGTLAIRDKAKGKAKKIEISEWNRVEGVYWLLTHGKQMYDADGNPDGVKIKAAKGTFHVKAVAWDTVTSIARVCMRNIVLGESESDPNKDILKRTLKNWGDMSEKLRYWLHQFKLLKEKGVMNVWVLQEHANSDELDSDEYSIYPAINQSVRTYILEEADMIFRTLIGKDKTGNAQFKISAKPNPLYVTKDRTGMLSGVIPDPNLEAMYKHAFKR